MFSDMYHFNVLISLSIPNSLLNSILFSNNNKKKICSRSRLLFKKRIHNKETMVKAHWNNDLINRTDLSFKQGAGGTLMNCYIEWVLWWWFWWHMHGKKSLNSMYISTLQCTWLKQCKRTKKHDISILNCTFSCILHIFVIFMSYNYFV